MLIQYKYPVVTSLIMSEHWPVNTRDIKLEWHTEGQKIVSVVATVPASENDVLPKVIQGEDPEIALHIDVGTTSRQDEVEEILRTLRGILGFFVPIEILFNEVKTSWLPETEEEKSKINLYDFSSKKIKPDRNAPRLLSYDLVARAMAAAKDLTDIEVPLEFLRRANIYNWEEEYFQAYYNLFFFLETLFAPGYSNPKEVEKRFAGAEPIKKSIETVRKSPPRYPNESIERYTSLLSMTDEELIKHLVKVRGELHHHALSRPGVWHPDKPQKYKEETILLQEIVHHIAMSDALKSMYTSEIGEHLFANAEAANAILKFTILAKGVFNGTHQELPPLTVRVIGRSVDREKIDQANKYMHDNFVNGKDGKELLEYKIMSEDGRDTYAIWSRHSSDHSS